MAASYTVFAHAEIEAYLERWATAITDIAETQWRNNRATKVLVHLCTFHDGRGDLSTVPKTDIWSEPINLAIRKQRASIASNNGIKESSVCKLFAPLGFDVRNVDPILLADLTAFGAIRGNHAHKGRSEQFGSGFDPFDRKAKAEALVSLLEVFDRQISMYVTVCD